MAIYYDQNVFNLQEGLNSAAEKIGVALYVPSLDDRFFNLNLGQVIRNQACHHMESFNVYDPGANSICAWSSLMSVVTGMRDCRYIEGIIPPLHFLCHTSEYEAMTVISAFSDYTEVIMVQSLKIPYT